MVLVKLPLFQTCLCRKLYEILQIIFVLCYVLVKKIKKNNDSSYKNYQERIAYYTQYNLIVTYYINSERGL